MLIGAVIRYINRTGTLEDALLALSASTGGGGGGATYPVPDNVFAVGNAIDLTKQLVVDAAGQAANTKTTITLGASISRPFRLPDISGTAVVQQDTTGFVFMGVGVTGQLHGSNAGMQYSTVFPGIASAANRAQLRCNLYGANTGAPGVTGFKSRGATIGSLGGCIAGDILWRMTAIGVAPDNASIPLAALLSIQVPANFVPAAQSWVPSELELQLKPLAGGTNDARISFKVTSEGETQSLRGVRAGNETATYTPAQAAAAIPTGALWSSGTGDPNGVLTGSPGDLYSRKDGGPGATIWTKDTGVATNTGWAPFRNPRGPIVSSYPSAGGKPAVLRVDGAGVLWMIDFGTGGAPSKLAGLDSYDITTNPLAPVRLGSWLNTLGAAFFNTYQMRFRGTVGFFVAAGLAPAAASNRLWAVDCSAPALPVVLGFGLTAGTAAQFPFDLALSSDSLTAAVGCEGAFGLQFWNITAPGAMVQYAATTVPALTVNGLDAASWPTLFVTDGVTGTLRAYDCSTVTANIAPPPLLGTLALSAGVRRVTVDPVRNLAYVVMKTEQQVVIVDITTPAAMVVLSRIPIGVGTSDEVQPVFFTYTPPGGVAINVLLQCTSCTSPGRIETWDVTVPASPKIIKQSESGQNLFYADITKLALGALYASNRNGEQELLTLDPSFLLPAA